MDMLEEKLLEIPYIDKLLEIKGIGLKTVSGFIAEVGDITRFDNPKQLQKLAGYAIVECSSGKHKGESHISYRGRKRLRYVLYEASISLIARNEEFKEVHRYYRTRKKNPADPEKNHSARDRLEKVDIPLQEKRRMIRTLFTDVILTTKRSNLKMSLERWERLRSADR